jgi:hypothetical protein
MKHKPVGVCSGCGKYVKNLSLVDTDCFRDRQGNKCKGSIRSAINIDDWEPCGVCSGESWDCQHCQGTGWRYVRNRIPR